MVRKCIWKTCVPPLPTKNIAIIIKPHLIHGDSERLMTTSKSICNFFKIHFILIFHCPAGIMQNIDRIQKVRADNGPLKQIISPILTAVLHVVFPLKHIKISPRKRCVAIKMMAICLYLTKRYRKHLFSIGKNMQQYLYYCASARL